MDDSEGLEKRSNFGYMNLPLPPPLLPSPLPISPELVETLLPTYSPTHDCYT